MESSASIFLAIDAARGSLIVAEISVGGRDESSGTLVMVEGDLGGLLRLLLSLSCLDDAVARSRRRSHSPEFMEVLRLMRGGESGDGAAVVAGLLLAALLQSWNFSCLGKLRDARDLVGDDSCLDKLENDV